METTFDVLNAVGAPPSAHGGVTFALVPPAALSARRGGRHAAGSATLSRACDPARLSSVAAVVDAMGEASAKAQGLGAVITTASKLSASSHRLYLAVAPSHTTVLGLLKVGVKHLFIRDETGRMTEIDPLCVLDFYVHESCQRQGLGQRLFEAMLRAEGAQPAKLAYDRPSRKLLAFLAKHNGLVDYTPQVNNFVVYKQFFQVPAAHGSGPAASSAAATASSGGGGGMASVATRPLTAAAAAAAASSAARRGRRGIPPDAAVGRGPPAGPGADGGIGVAVGGGGAACGPRVVAYGRRAGKPSPRARDAYSYGTASRASAAAHASASRAVAEAYGDSSRRSARDATAPPASSAAPSRYARRDVHVSAPSHVPGLGPAPADGGAPPPQRDAAGGSGPQPSRSGYFSPTVLSRPF